MQDFMRDDVYKVNSPRVRSEWYEMNGTDDDARSRPDYAVVILGILTEQGIKFSIRYFHDFSWKLTESLGATSEHFGCSPDMLRYVPRNGTTRCDSNGLINLTELLQGNIDLRYELPHNENLEEDATSQCPCGRLLQIVQDVDWIQCDKCGKWWHCTCAGHDGSSDFTCSICSGDFTQETPIAYTATGTKFNKRPSISDYVQLISSTFEAGTFEASEQVCKKRRLGHDDKSGPFKRGPGRAKSGRVFHSMYGWADGYESENGDIVVWICD